jgi:hypothetical protein
MFNIRQAPSICTELRRVESCDAPAARAFWTPRPPAGARVDVRDKAAAAAFSSSSSLILHPAAAAASAVVAAVVVILVAWASSRPRAAMSLS